MYVEAEIACCITVNGASFIKKYCEFGIYYMNSASNVEKTAAKLKQDGNYDDTDEDCDYEIEIHDASIENIAGAAILISYVDVI